MPARLQRQLRQAVGAQLVYEPAEPHGARFVLVLPEARISQAGTAFAETL